jgi:hypothetical protein
MGAARNVHEFVGRSIEHIMRVSLMRRSYDNVTVVIIGLKSLENAVRGIAPRSLSNHFKN